MRATALSLYSAAYSMQWTIWACGPINRIASLHGSSVKYLVSIIHTLINPYMTQWYVWRKTFPCVIR